MEINVFAIYFSPTGNTKKVTRAIAGGIAKALTNKDYFSIDITAINNREGTLEFGTGDIVVVGMPTYAGRVPNKLEPYISEAIYGDKALVVPVVTYGNRAYDDSLFELSNILWNNGMDILGYAAVPTEHAFSDMINPGHPNKEDINVLFEYGMKLGNLVKENKVAKIIPNEIERLHKDELVYYTPLKENHEPAKFLKAMPKTNMELCTECGTCKQICPMGCFDNSPLEPAGICIKCQACVKKCPANAKYFDDADFLSHINMLKNEYGTKQNTILIANSDEAYVSPEIKLGLQRIKELLKRLENPQDKLKFIHVAGTNGKGSTVCYISNILKKSGLKVGTYTSPAVNCRTEQYTIDGLAIDDGLFDKYLKMITAIAEEIKDKPSKFEIETALAFLYFEQQKCDIVILEAGLGGLLDATNIVSTTEIAVLTSISTDHLKVIGNSLEEIAENKSGIIKKNIPTVLLEPVENSDVVLKIIKEKANEMNSKLTIVEQKDFGNSKLEDGYLSFAYRMRKDIYNDASLNLVMSTKMIAEYQMMNASLAAMTAYLYLSKQNLTEDFIVNYIVDGIRDSQIPFRMEKINDNPLIYLDGAHNPDAANMLKTTIVKQMPHKKVILVLGCFKDKDYREIIKTLVPLASSVFTVETPDSERALPSEILAARVCEFAEKAGIKGNIEIKNTLSLKDAAILSVNECRKEMKDSVIVCCGSLSYLSEMKKWYKLSNNDII